MQAYDAYLDHQVQIAFQYQNDSLPLYTPTYPSWTHINFNLFQCPTSTFINNLNYRTEEIRGWLRGHKHPSGLLWESVCSKECKDIVDKLYQPWNDEPELPAELYDWDLFHIYDRHYVKEDEDLYSQEFLQNSKETHTSYFMNVSKNQLQDYTSTNFTNVFSSNYSALLFYHTMVVPTTTYQPYQEFYKAKLYTYTRLAYSPGGIGGRSEFYSSILKL